MSVDKSVRVETLQYYTTMCKPFVEQAQRHEIELSKCPFKLRKRKGVASHSF